MKHSHLHQHLRSLYTVIDSNGLNRAFIFPHRAVLLYTIRYGVVLYGRFMIRYCTVRQFAVK